MPVLIITSDDVVDGVRLSPSPAGSATGPRSTMDMVLEISLQEEEVHSKLTETEKAITSLQELLQKTQAQLTKRQDMKRKVTFDVPYDVKKYLSLSHEYHVSCYLTFYCFSASRGGELFESKTHGYPKR